MDILENEQGRETQRSPWLARLVAGIAAAAIAVAVVPTLLSDLSSSSPSASAEATPPPVETAAPSPASPAPSPLSLREPTQTNAHVLLAGRQLSILDVDGGHTHTLFLPEAYGSARPGGVTRLPDVTVVLAERPPSVNDPNAEVFAIQDTGVTIPLGIAATVLPASHDSVWLSKQEEDESRTIRLVGIDGLERLPAQTLPAGLRLVAVQPSTLVLGVRPFGREPERIIEWDPVSGTEKNVLAQRGLVHDADGNRLLWQECSDCTLQTYDWATGMSTPLAPLPADLQLTGGASLSPDGRHWAGIVTVDDSSDRLAVVLGHLPGSEYAERTSTHLDLPSIGRVGRPRMSWSESGWLFVSTGYSLWAVSPGPHQAFALDAPDHDGIAAW
jgi:hypothetical protein